MQPRVCWHTVQSRQRPSGQRCLSKRRTHGDALYHVLRPVYERLLTHSLLCRALRSLAACIPCRSIVGIKCMGAHPLAGRALPHLTSLRLNAPPESLCPEARLGGLEMCCVLNTRGRGPRACDTMPCSLLSFRKPLKTIRARRAHGGRLRSTYILQDMRSNQS